MLLPVSYIEPKKIATDFGKELRRIKTKFLPAGYPVKFINDTFFRFNKEEEKLLILKGLFDETKLVVIRFPFAPRNEKLSKDFISKLQIRWNEHENETEKNLECFKHLQEHLSHVFQWSVLSIAARNTFKQKILEAYFIKMVAPSLNSQINNDVLTLFRNGIS